MYEDPTNPPRSARPSQGQRCPSCGHLDPDPLARFCGVCGSMMSASVAPAPPTGPTAQYPQHGYDSPARHAPAIPATAYAQPPSLPGAGYPGQGVVYTVPRIDLVGAGQIGAAISAAFNLLPCLLFAWGVTSLVNGVRWSLDALTGASIRIPIPIASIDVPVNYVDLFRLRQLYDAVIFWDDRLWLTFILSFIVPWVLSIVAGALYGGALAAVYNVVGKASGGMRVTLVSTQAPLPGHAVAPAAWSPPLQPPPRPAWPNQGWPPPDQRR